MKNQLFIFLLFGLLAAVWPGTVNAEILRPATANPDLTVFEKYFSSCPAEQLVKSKKATKWKEIKHKILRLLFQKWRGEDGERDWLIVAIVLLSIGVFIFGLYGLTALIFSIVFWDASTRAVLFVLLALAMLALAALCLVGINKNAKKLRKLKYSETPPKELPKRPPSKRKD